MPERERASDPARGICNGLAIAFIMWWLIAFAIRACGVL